MTKNTKISPDDDYEVTQTIRQPHLSATVQARRFFLFSHIARMPD